MAEGNIPALAGDPSGISEAALKKAEEFIEADEGAINRLSGTAGNVTTIVAVVMSVFHLYAAIAAAAFVFVYACLPETRGRSLEDMEELFHTK